MFSSANSPVGRAAPPGERCDESADPAQIRKLSQRAIISYRPSRGQSKCSSASWVLRQRNKLHELSGFAPPLPAPKAPGSLGCSAYLKAAALVQQTQGHPHGAVCHPGQNVRSVGEKVDVLLPNDIEQLGDVLRRIRLRKSADGRRKGWWPGPCAALWWPG